MAFPVPRIDPGRPVFFIRPHSVVQNELLFELIRHEFEVATLKEHEKVRDLFSLYPVCIAFLNIDEGYSEPEWADLVREVQDDPKTAAVRLGILTYQSEPELTQKYLLELAIPCGFVKLTLGLKESTQLILKVLEANEAKGRRNFLRAPCPTGSAHFNLIHKGKTLEGNLVDISSVGMSGTFIDDPGFVSHSVIPNIQLKLKGIICQVSAFVMGTRKQSDGMTLYVLLFDPGKTPDSIRDKIWGYIRKALQANLDEALKT